MPRPTVICAVPRKRAVPPLPRKRVGVLPRKREVPPPTCGGVPPPHRFVPRKRAVPPLHRRWRGSLFPFSLVRQLGRFGYWKSRIGLTRSAVTVSSMYPTTKTKTTYVAGMSLR